MSRTPVNNLAAGDLITVTVSGTYKFMNIIPIHAHAHVLVHDQLGHHGVRGRQRERPAKADPRSQWHEP